MLRWHDELGMANRWSSPLGPKILIKDITKIQILEDHEICFPKTLTILPHSGATLITLNKEDVTTQTASLHAKIVE